MDKFKKQIQKVIDGEVNSVRSENLISPDVVVDYLESIGFEDEDIDTNGWDWDFWINLSKEGKKFVLSGSGYYNRGISFYKNEEE